MGGIKPDHEVDAGARRIPKVWAKDFSFFYGKNQAECCTGETAENLAVPDTDEVVAVAEGDRPKKG